MHEAITSVVSCLHDMVVPDNFTLTTLDGHEIPFCCVICHIIFVSKRSHYCSYVLDSFEKSKY